MVTIPMILFLAALQVQAQDCPITQPCWEPPVEYRCHKVADPGPDGDYIVCPVIPRDPRYDHGANVVNYW
jgi:hypothetical protein